jgi:hypothetical protein
MTRHPDRHGVETRPRQVADRGGVTDGGDDGQRARPEGPGQGHRPIVEIGDAGGDLDVGDMSDQRVEARTALGLEDRRHGGGARGVRAKAIDGLGRQQHEPTGGERTRRVRYFRLAVSAKLTFTFAAI